jgi:Domain of unknown function (DUF4386)
VLLPYIILTIQFEYPDILREETGAILSKFQAGGSSLIWTWWFFAILGLPLIPAYILIGKQLQNSTAAVRWATTIGVIGLITQMVGLLRWTFVVPILAKNYMEGNEATKEASKVGFQIIHQFGGVILGEHIGQIFTIIWTVVISYALTKTSLIPRWLGIMGYIASIIYLGAQTELFNTVIPSISVINIAGFLGSTLWIIWLLLIGIYFTISQKTSQ